MAGARVIKLDSGHKIVRKLYKPGAPLDKWGTMVAERAEELAKTNNGRGWVYQRPSQRVERYKGGNAHGRYAAGLRSSGGSQSDPTVRLEATAPHSRLVEFGNGSRDIQAKGTRELHEMALRARREIRELEAQRAKLNRSYSLLDRQAKALVRRQVEERRRAIGRRIADRRKYIEDMRSRFVLSTPSGIRAPHSVRPMGRGKYHSDAEIGGYRTVNRAMREAVRQVAKETRGK